MRPLQGSSFFVGVAVLAGVLGAGCKGRFRLPPDARFVKQVAVAPTFACGRMKDASVRCWGSNESGQLGDGTSEARAESVRANLTVPALTVATGDRGACALGADGSMACWGGIAAPPGTITRATAVAVGGRHACALVGGGALQCWGADDAGQVSGAGGLHGTAIAASGDASCVLDSDRRVTCWGRVPGRPFADVSPARVEGLADVLSVAMSETHACVVLAWGGVTCWGKNDHGELGNGTLTDSARPVAVSPLDGAKRVAVGRGHSCALLGNGTVRCWGANAASQLADGARDDRPTPALVQGAFDVKDISAAGDASCILFDDGSARCWGGLRLPKTDTVPVTVPMEVRW